MHITLQGPQGDGKTVTAMDALSCLLRQSKPMLFLNDTVVSTSTMPSVDTMPDEQLLLYAAQNINPATKALLFDDLEDEAAYLRARRVAKLIEERPGNTVLHFVFCIQVENYNYV